jgi:hypothetical protein
MAPQRQDGAHAHPCLSLQGPKTDLDFTMQHDMPHPHHESPWRIFIAFLRLGISCFGGPIAHLGYFAPNLYTAGAGWMTTPMAILLR